MTIPPTPGIQPGLSTTRRIVVDLGRTISFMGEEVRIYATPWLISDIEYTCRDLIVAYVAPGEDSLGLEVAIRHLAPTPVGGTVDITVRVAAVSGRKVTLDVTARNEIEVIGGGTHTRVIVGIARTIERLMARAAQRAAPKP